MRDFAGIRHIVLDMDGTIYLGGTLLPHTLEFLARLNRVGIGYSFVSNNCSRSRADYARYLGEIGIQAKPETIWTSAHATIQYLRNALPQVRRLFVLGTPGLDDDLQLGGFEMVGDRPDAVVVGFDTALTYDRLARTAYWISRGLPYIATHPDRVSPTDRATVLPDCGAICALFESATGRKPDAVPGKPNPGMIESVLLQTKLQPRQVAMVGDRIYTDMRMASDAGVLAVLTLTGEATKADVDKCPAEQRPDVVINNLGEFADMLEGGR